MRVRNWEAVGAFVAAIVAGAGVSRLGLPSALSLLILTSAGLVVLPFTVAAYRRRLDVFEPVYLFAFAFGLLFVIRPTADASRGLDILWLDYDVRPTYAKALAVAALGAAAFYAGYYVHLGKRWARAVPLAPRSWSQAVLNAYILLAVVLCAGLFGVFVQRSGGTGALRTIIDGRSDARTDTLASASGYLYAAPLWLTALGIFVLAAASRWRSGVGAAGFALVGLSQITSIAGGNRSWSLPALGALILVRYLRRDRRPGPAPIAAVLAIVFIVGITVPREYRNVVARQSSLATVTIDAVRHPLRAFEAFVEGPDTAMAANLAVELQFVPSQVAYKNGSTFLEAAARPVPRHLWPDKPPAADQLLMSEIWPSFADQHVGFSFSVFGEPYLNGGFLGVMLVAAAFGLFWRVAYEWFMRDRLNPAAVALFAMNWPFLFVYMRGGLGVDYHRHVMTIVPLVIALLLARRLRVARPQLAPQGGLA